MARNRLREDSSSASTGSSLSGGAKKQMAQRKTGKMELDKEYNTAVWLNFEVMDRNMSHC